MAKKRRLEEILAQREKAKQNTSNSRNVRQISTGLPTTRQQMVMPRRTTTEVQALAQSLFNRSNNMTAEQQKVASVAQNYQPIRNNGLAQNNNKNNVQKAISNYNPNFRQTGAISKEEINKDKFLDRVKNEKGPKAQQKKLQQYNSLFHEDKNINLIRKEVKDAETVDKINNGTTAEKVFNTAKFMLQGTVEGAVGTLGQINATAQNISRNTNYNKVKKAQEYANSYQQSLQNVENGLVKFGGQVTNTVGAMLPSIGMNLIAPGTGNIMAGVSAGSSAYLETLNEGQDNKGKAMLTGVLKGTLAGTIEKIIGGNKIGPGALDDIAVKNIAKVKSQLAQKLLSKGYEVVGEVGEENLENFAGYLVDMAINNKKVTVEDAVRDLIDTTGTTAGATLLLSALGLGGGTFNDVQNQSNKNNQIKNSGLTENQQQKLTEVAEKYDLSQADIQNLIDNTKNGKYDQKQVTTMKNKAISNQSQQVIQTEGKKAKNKTSKEIKSQAKKGDIRDEIISYLEKNGRQTSEKNIEAFINRAQNFKLEENDNTNPELRNLIEKIQKDNIKKDLSYGNSFEEAQQQVKKFKNLTDISNKKRVEIDELTELNMKERPDYKDIEEVKARYLIEANLQPGKRNDIEVETLIKKIKENGFIRPIYISKETGKVINGVHRILVAYELGLDNVPVKYVDSANDIEKIDMNENDWYNAVKDRRDGIGYTEDRTTETSSRNTNERVYNQGRVGTSGYRGDNEENNKIYQGKQGNINRPSNEAIHDISNTVGRRSIKDSNESSFSMQKNNLETEKSLLDTTEVFENYKKSSFGAGKIAQERLDDFFDDSFEKESDKRQLVDEVYREDIAEGKVRKHYKSVFDSNQVGDVGKDVAKELLKKDTYVPISNLETITAVNDNISRNGIGATYNAFRTKVRSNEKITLQDVATGERLIQIYSQKGDYAKVNELIQDVAILGTELGQQVQALSLIKRASPEGQLQYLTKLLERTNIKENTNIKITDEMTEKILGAKNQEDLEKKLTEVAVELAEQLPVSKSDMIRSWRYLSMLGNPKTHIKNFSANVAMNLTQRAKNAVAGAIEGVASVFNPEMERTKTIKFANREQKQFAKQDAELMKDLIDAGGKYDVKNVIQESKKQFNNKVLNAIADFNSKLLDKEDKIFLKSAYKMAMQNYMSANNLKASDMEGKTLEKARQYASLQAQEATFHEFNVVAQHLSQIENKGGLIGGAMSAVLPFKKTPMNIAKAGIQYSPVGLASSVTYDVAQIAKQTKKLKQQLSEGKITEEQYKSETSRMVNKTIDNMAKGLTGTSLAVLGYALAKMGVLKAGNDGEDDEFKQKLGEQEYAITIGDNTYTLDWVSPSAIPMFTGASIYQLMTGDVEDQKSVLNSTLTAFSKTFEPMTDMSMLQGLTSAITSYEQGSSNMIFDLGASMVTSYAGQFVPTVAGQVARIADPYERDTSSTKKGIEGKVDKFAKQTMNKIPGLSQKLPKKTDVWGEDVKRPENLVQRTLETAVLPWTRKSLVEDRTAQELLKVFDESGENVLPGNPNKDLTINKIKYRMSTEEYNEAKRNFGQTSKALLDDLFKSKTYNTLTAEGKAKAIDDVYAYAKEKIKVEYAEDNNHAVKPTNLYNTVTSLEENNADVSAYFEFKGKIDDLDREKGEESVKNKEKMSYLKEMKTDAKTKRIIYEDTLGTNDEVYQNLSKLTGNKVNIDQYLDYKTAEIKGIDDPKSIVKGKTKSGSKKANLQKYLRESNFSEVEALYIYGTQNSLNSTQRVQITNYINKAKQAGRLTASEEKELYKKLNSVEELEDGRIRWK